MKYADSKSPVAREAHPFFFPLLLAALATLLLQWYAWALLLLILALYVLWFFRNPQRTPASASALAVISPADGKITAIGLVPAEGFDDGQALRIAVFMSLFNVHMNWSPMSGTITSDKYFPGKFLNAMDDKAGDENERKILHLRTTQGKNIIIKLIAGLVARRIVSPVKSGDDLKQGEKIGLIRFGSRVEVLLPSDSELKVSLGEMVQGGHTLLAILKDSSTPIILPENPE
jgi:phosphatidylserine decarboxylase